MNQKVTNNPRLSSQQKNNRSKTSAKKKSPPHSKLPLSLKANSRKGNKKLQPRKKKTTNSLEKDRSKFPKKRKQAQYNKAVYAPIALLSRLAIMTMGIGTILGSLISVANSLNSNSAIDTNPSSTTNQTIINPELSALESNFSLITVGREIIPLKQQLQTITQKYSELEAGILIADLRNQNYVNIAATNTFSAASTIKLPILIAFFQDVEAGKIDLDESLTMTEKNIAKGSGYMQYQKIGSEFSASKTATAMITVSDNTATNMLIEQLGGVENLNQRFFEWGLTATKVRNLLPDLSGTNTTSSEDLSNLLLKMDRGELVSSDSQERILEIMKQTRTNNLLPQGLGQDATIAHKTGNLNSILGDTGIVEMSNGQRYIISVLVKRPKEDPQAQSLIQEVSRTAYQYFKQPQTNSTAKTKKLPTSVKSDSFLAE